MAQPFFQAKPLRPVWLYRLSENDFVHFYAHKTLWHPLQAASCKAENSDQLFEACLTAAALVPLRVTQRIGFHCISLGSLCTAGQHASRTGGRTDQWRIGCVAQQGWALQLHHQQQHQQPCNSSIRHLMLAATINPQQGATAS